MNLDKSTSLDRSISIHAGAGCGKTHELINRVLLLLESGRTTIDRILLLTFSENSALEMRQRLQKSLVQVDRSWAKHALRDIEKVNVMTIHSFAYDICRQFHKNLKLNPTFSVVSSQGRKPYEQEFFDTIYNEIANNPLYFQHFKTLFTLNIKKVHILEAFRKLLEKIPLGNKKRHVPKKHILKQKDINKIKKIASELANISNVAQENSGTRAKKRISTFSEYARTFSTLPNDNVIEFILKRENYINKASFNISKSAKWPPAYKQFESLVCALGIEIEIAEQHIIDNVLDDLTKELINKICQYRKQTFEIGLITFDETIFCTRSILENELNRELIWTKYDSVILDEFQDTDENQLAIIQYLIDDSSIDDLARFFAVGDENQSIYGFRGVCLSSYKHFIDLNASDHLKLTGSKRSVSSVIHTINNISANLLDNYEPITAVRNDFNKTETPHTFVRNEELTTTTTDIRNQQALDCIKDLKDILLNSNVYDIESQAYRKSELSDIAILIRDKSSLPSLFKYLKEYNLEYVIETNGNEYDLASYKILLNIFNACTDPTDVFSVIGTLKSPLFCLTNDDLAHFAFDETENKENIFNTNSHNSIWDYRSYQSRLDNNTPSTTVHNALVQLNELYRQVSLLSPTQLIENIFKNSGLYEVFSYHFGHDQTIMLSNYLSELAASFEENHPASHISEFVNYINICRKDRVPFKRFVDSNKQAIKIMTVHASKGLEFPVVAYIPSQMNFINNSVDVHKDMSTNTYCISFNMRVSSTSFKNSQNDNKNKRLDEEARLSYVAMTRARDYLYIYSHHKKSNSQYSQATQLSAAINQTAA